MFAVSGKYCKLYSEQVKLGIDFIVLRDVEVQRSTESSGMKASRGFSDNNINKN